MPSLLVPRSEGNWGAAYDVLVTPKTNIIMNKVYVQTYNGGYGGIVYRLRIADESTGQIVYDISSTEETADNNRVSISPNIWKDFQDVKMLSGKTYRLSLTTITQDSSNYDNGTHGSRDPFNGASNEHLEIKSASRKYGRSALQFPEWKFDYTLDEPKGIRVRSTTASAKGIKTIAKPTGTQEGDVLVLYVNHYNDAIIDSNDGFIKTNTSEFSTMLYKVATKYEPEEYPIRIATAQLSWIEMSLMSVADAKVVNYGMVDKSGSSFPPVTTTRVNSRFAVIAASSLNDGSSALLPLTERYGKMCSSIVPVNKNVTIYRNSWDSRTKFIILDENIKRENTIKHIGTTAPATSYSGINYITSWPVPRGIQVGDLIVVMAQSTGSISNSAIISPFGYTKVAEATSNGSMGSSLFYKIATKEDIDSTVSVDTPRSPTGLGFGSINVYRNGKFLTGGVEKTIGFSTPIPSPQEEVVLLQQVRNNYENPRVGFTRIAEHKYGATTMHKYFYNVNNTVPSSIDGDYPEYGVPFTVIGYSEGNEPPTKPELFVKQPTVNSMNLSGESVQLEWTVSTDKEGDSISYEVELYNGSDWVSVESSVTVNFYATILPSLDTDKAQFRVRAKDNKGGKSDYTLGNVFTIATRLLLVQDNNIVKSYKDGVWKAIQ
ncbi:TPA: fibronectin type III domain-containing protein [Bacillus cereus]